MIVFVNPQKALEVDDVEGKIKGLFTSFTANFSYSSTVGDKNGESVDLYTGKIYYQYPNKLNIQISDGRVIATNGKYLWVYNPDTKICGRQAVKEENIGGLFYFLHGGYSVQEDNGRYIFQRPGSALGEVTLKVDGDILKSVQFKIKDNVNKIDTVINASFSNVVTDTNIKASLFNYKPDPDAQLIENPLNRVANGFIQK